MSMQTKKPRLKPIYKNPLAEKLKAKHSKVITQLRIKKSASNSRQRTLISKIA